MLFENLPAQTITSTFVAPEVSLQSTTQSVMNPSGDLETGSMTIKLINNTGLSNRLSWPIKITLTKYPTTYHGILDSVISSYSSSLNASVSFRDMAAGDYEYTVTDNCGYTITGNKATIRGTDIPISTTQSLVCDGTDTQTGSLRLNKDILNGSKYQPIKMQMTEYPAAYTGITEISNFANLYTFSNIAAGEYKIMFVNSIGDILEKTCTVPTRTSPRQFS